MPVDRRRLILGAAAAAVVLGLAAWTFWPSSAPASPTAARARSGRSGPAAVAPVDRVKLEELTASRDEPGGAPRDPFRFQPKAPPPAPKVSTPIVTEAPPRPVPMAPPGPPPLPPIGLKFIGILERANGVKVAVLSDGKSSPMFGKEGEIIDGKYLIVKIGTESVEMTYTDGRGRQVIRLSGQ